MLILDSTGVPTRERADFVRTALAESSRAAVALENPDAGVHARMELWQLGPISLFRNESSGIRMFRAARHARADPTPVVALAVHERSPARLDQFGGPQDISAGELMAVDLGAPFEFAWSTHGASRALQLPANELGLPAEVIRRAATRLPSSSLYDLVRSHIVDLFRAAGRLSRDPAATALGATSVDLARALFASAGADHTRAARETHHQTLLAQIREYTRQHLRDPDLSPARIAAAHAISLRHLYSLCAAADFSLEQWIIGRRLEGARDELARPDAAGRSIAMIARRWGFRDPTHFGRRFKSTYGLTPRDWRVVAHEAAGQDAPTDELPAG